MLRPSSKIDGMTRPTKPLGMAVIRPAAAPKLASFASPVRRQSSRTISLLMAPGMMPVMAPGSAMIATRTQEVIFTGKGSLSANPSAIITTDMINRAIINRFFLPVFFAMVETKG
ncbi:MAG: hypothetical protein ACD_35C00138G0002 [uncultured bacterium]|nr:MAG: hypothetical protein ACD_35C00138G0002 [uncultured bacterium]